MQVKYETSLEEAKKIKELGYDFSFIDKDFFVDCDWDIDEGYIYSDSLVRITNMGKSEPYSRYQVIEFIKPITYDSGGKSEIDDDNFFVNLKQMTTISQYSREGTVFDVYPIIPYPILEACLPGDVMRYHNWNYCIKAYLNYPETQIMGEAFIYCVRNYPEETKAKFNELKERYK